MKKGICPHDLEFGKDFDNSETCNECRGEDKLQFEACGDEWEENHRGY